MKELNIFDIFYISINVISLFSFLTWNVLYVFSVT